MKNFILVGLGPHAKRIYYPFLEKHQAKYNINLKLLIELDSQILKVNKFLEPRKIKPEKIIYLPNNGNNRFGKKLDSLAKKELDSIIKQEKIDGIIISTEPKAHKIYAEWALKNNINILMDKPITSPPHPCSDIKAAKKIYQDYLDLSNLLKNSRAKFYINCQRRNHQGYVYIKNYLEDFIKKFSVPISYIDIYHSDGAWSLPHEFYKENHPYKYGYGKLMHSGYHFIDLFAWLASTNFCLKKLKPDNAKLSTERFAPNDLFKQIDRTVLKKFFNEPTIEKFYKNYQKNDYDNFGELDAYILLQLKQKDTVITTGTINLQQNSFSRRGWFELPEDIYKGNGRTRHERVNIQVSHFLNIQIHSYQSNEPNITEEGEIGSQDHFDIYIFRNTKIVGGEAFTKISIGKEMKRNNKKDHYYLGHNEEAREKILLHFINRQNDPAEFQYHDLTNKLLSEIYISMAQNTKTGNSQVSFKL